MLKRQLIGIFENFLGTNTSMDFLSKLTKSEIEKLTVLTKRRVERSEQLTRPRFRLSGGYFSKADHGKAETLT